MKYPINWLSFSTEESNGPGKIPISSAAKVGAQDTQMFPIGIKVGIFPSSRRKRKLDVLIGEVLLI